MANSESGATFIWAKLCFGSIFDLGLTKILGTLVLIVKFNFGPTIDLVRPLFGSKFDLYSYWLGSIFDLALTINWTEFFGQEVGDQSLGALV